jgi:hypothetical protein
MAGKHIVCVDEESKHKKKLKYHFFKVKAVGTLDGAVRIV